LQQYLRRPSCWRSLRFQHPPQTLAVALSNPDKNIAPVTAKAERISDDRWRAQISAVALGKWSLALGIGLAPDDKVAITAPILIE